MHLATKIVKFEKICEKVLTPIQKGSILWSRRTGKPVKGVKEKVQEMKKNLIKTTILTIMLAIAFIPVSAFASTSESKREDASKAAAPADLYITNVSTTANSAKFTVKTSSKDEEIVVRYADNKEMDNAKEVSVNSNNTSFEITNLKSASKYFVEYRRANTIVRMEVYTLGPNPTLDKNNAITKAILAKANTRGNITVELPYAVSKNVISKYIYQLETTYPQYFLKYNYAARLRVSGSGVVAVMFTYDSASAKKEAAVNKKVDEIVKVAKKQKNQKAKIQYVENELCKLIKYNKSTANCRNTYGALVEKKANCMGYSAAFALCMNKLGIQVETKTNNAGSHIWNMVKVGSKWVNNDACWDDANRTVGKITFRNAKNKDVKVKKYTTERYFLKASHQM